jgi:hypothetical protein
MYITPPLFSHVSAQWAEVLSYLNTTGVQLNPGSNSYSYMGLVGLKLASPVLPLLIYLLFIYLFLVFVFVWNINENCCNKRDSKQVYMFLHRSK